MPDHQEQLHGLMQESVILDQPYQHQPVLCEELVTGLNVNPGGSYLDATVGGGGHAAALLQAGASILVGLDHDPNALAAARSHLETFIQALPSDSSPAPQIHLHHLNFADFQLDQHSYRDDQDIPQPFDGILADLGVSSPQLDQPERGFSFRHDGPLDMRMDPTSAGPTAADLVNHADETELADHFFQYGEERYSRRIARHIVRRRPFTRTLELAEAIRSAVPPAARRGRIDPATRVFQALRIWVNQELQVLETWLQRAPDWLKPEGRIAVISFHSLEDRLVKHHFRQDPRLQVITRKPIQAQPQELAINPRARSAKLRIAARSEPMHGGTP